MVTVSAVGSVGGDRVGIEPAKLEDADLIPADKR